MAQPEETVKNYKENIMVRTLKKWHKAQQQESEMNTLQFVNSMKNHTSDVWGIWAMNAGFPHMGSQEAWKSVADAKKSDKKVASQQRQNERQTSSQQCLVG